MNHHNTDRYDYMINHEDHTYRISFLHHIQAIIYTRMDGKRAGEIYLNHPIDSTPPDQNLLLNKVINHMNKQDRDTRAEQWPEQYA